MQRLLAVLVAAVLAALAVAMPTTGAVAAPADAGFSAEATWVNDTLTVVYSWNGLPAGATQGGLHIVHGHRVTVRDDRPATDRVVTERVASRTAEALTLIATVDSCRPDPVSGGSVCTTEVLWKHRVPRHHIRRQAGEVAATSLLADLRVRPESHAASFDARRFRFGIDADHDGRGTRQEVLRAESRVPVTAAHGRVVAGRWLSRYDGVTVTDPARLRIDHLVSLREAWTSGAAAWSERRRTAYANDLGYAASLNAITREASMAKGDAEPNGSLPSSTAYSCAYVKGFIAVKHRWGLSIDASERQALRMDLALLCIDPWVTAPRAPDLAALTGR